MSQRTSSTDRVESPATSPAELAFADPLGEYHFEVELDATSPHCPDEFPHRVFAHRRYTDVSNISPVWPTLPAVHGLLERLINSHIEGKDGPLASHGVTVTTVFCSSSGSGYVPTDILVNGHSIDAYTDIDSAGLWRLPKRLISLVESQSTRTVTSTQVPFDACADQRVPRHGRPARR